MKKLLSFLFMLMMCLTAQATGLSDLKFGQAQIADSQWNVQACTQTTTCQIYSKNPGTAYKIPWTNGQLSWAAGDYVAFAATGNSANPFNAVQYAANGTQKAVMGTGHIVNMGSDYFFFVGNDNNTGQLFSMTQGFNNTSGVTWTGTLNPTVAQVNAYAANGSTTPLAAGQRAAPTPAPPVNNTTPAGTMPGGYIGRILNNVPGQSQNYSFTYTPGQTGSQYVQLAFRQDPAFWTVTNVTLTAGGSSTNLLQNGNFATGGTITAQTNNGPMDVNTPTYWGVAYQSGIYPGAAGSWSPGQWYDGAVGSFDAIYQGVNLTVGVTYTVTVTVRGDNTSNNNLNGEVQLGVYAAPCGSLTLSPDQCTLPSNSGYTTLATPSEGASAGNTAPTPTGSSTSNVVTSSSSIGSTTTISNPYTFGNQTFTVTGTGTPTTTTTSTTPVTTTYWSDGTTTISNGTTTTTSNTTWNYTVTGPNTPPMSPNVGTNRNSVYITQTNAGANNNITTNQSGHGNYESVSLGGSNNIVRLGQGYTFSTSGVATESNTASNHDLSTLTVSGNFNGIINSQVGASNSAIISATGNYNSLLATQTGNNNQVYSTISGNNNSLSFGQNGNSNIAAANLYGNNNVATVTQTGNNHGVVLSLVNAGGANNVSVVQTGIGDAYSLQEICTNPAGCSVSVIRNK